MTPPPAAEERETRWNAERDFFDRRADDAATELRPFPARVLERYAVRRSARFSKEFRFAQMGNLQGRRVLDLGCGDGTNATILAMLGATVLGIDLSPGALAVARARARINGVSARTEFRCTSLEQLRLDEPPFDIVWCDSILHHVIPALDDVVEKLPGWIAPGGMLVIAEPMNRARWLRAMRLRVRWVAVRGTPNERPLEEAELRHILARLPWLELRAFALLGRLNRLILGSAVLEEVSAPRRVAVELLALLDAILLRPPTPIRRLAGSCVLFGRRPA